MLLRTWAVTRCYNHLEQKATRVVTASELQAWATKLLALNPTGTNLTPAHVGPNFPRQLLTLCPRLGPHIAVCGGQDSNYQPWVRIAWGSAGLGQGGFEVGDINFVSLQPGHAWSPGVYFFKR